MPETGVNSSAVVALDEKMIANGLQDRNDKGEEYLQHLRLLALELERAMHAISRNSLSEFEDGLRRQETLSARITELAAELRSPSHTRVAAYKGDELMQQVRIASGALQTLNQRYGALLQHSRRSVAMMVSLFESCNGNLQEGSGSRLNVHTWSCQV